MMQFLKLFEKTIHQFYVLYKFFMFICNQCFNKFICKKHCSKHPNEKNVIILYFLFELTTVYINVL